MRVVCCLLLLLVSAMPDAIADESPQALVDLDTVRSEGRARPVDGLSTAGQPDEAAFRVFADSGYGTVIDMRGPDEDRGLDDEAALVDELGMNYVALPVVGPGAVNFDNAAKLDALLAGQGDPVLVHCGSGNRVGALLALRAAMHGASDDEALALGRDSGMTGLEPLVRARLAEYRVANANRKIDEATDTSD